MDYKKSYKIMIAGIFGGFALRLLGELFFDGGALVTAGIATILGGIFQAMLFLKCPHCSASLIIRGGLPRYCPECGGRLD